jgi:hypothetical protein
MFAHLTAVATPGAETQVEQQAGREWPRFDHEIGLTEAREMINRYRRASPGTIHAAAVTRIALDRVLEQAGCCGVRLYFAMNPDGTPTLVGVGVDAEGNDMDEGELFERLYPCPPFCGINSALDV